MTEKEFNEACRYANSKLNGLQVTEALEAIEHREPIPYEISNTLYDAMEEWCEEHDLCEGEWLEWGEVEDVFLNQE